MSFGVPFGSYFCLSFSPPSFSIFKQGFIYLLYVSSRISNTVGGLFFSSPPIALGKSTAKHAQVFINPRHTVKKEVTFRGRKNVRKEALLRRGEKEAFEVCFYVCDNSKRRVEIREAFENATEGVCRSREALTERTVQREMRKMSECLRTGNVSNVKRSCVSRMCLLVLLTWKPRRAHAWNSSEKENTTRLKT